MTFISYSDNLEDVMLWRAFADLGRGHYLDILAGSRAQGSVTRAFYEKGWVGLNVTADTTVYQTLTHDRPKDIHLNAAVGDSDVDQVKTLASLWQACLPGDQPVHFLHLDAAGTEKQVILGNDWTRFRPWVLVIASRSASGEVGADEVGPDGASGEAGLDEAGSGEVVSGKSGSAEAGSDKADSHQAWEPLLLGHQYRFAYADGVNRFYVAQEHGERLSCFQYPPNVFDDYITEPHQRAELALTEATLRLRAMETRYQQVLQQSLGAKSMADRAQAELIACRAELQATYDSLSWRITSPVRRLQSLLRSLLGAGWKSRLKSAIKKPIVYLARKILSHRASKAFVIRLATRLGVYERFRSLLSGQSFFGGQGPNEPYAPSRYWIATARSRRVRSDLNAEVEQIRRERA